MIGPPPLKERRRLKSAPYWVSLLAHLMVLLVAVFIFLFSTSNPDLKKWQAMKDEFQAGLGGGGGSGKKGGAEPVSLDEFQKRVVLARLAEKLRLALADLIQEGLASVEETEEGFLLRMQADGLFYRGTVRIRSDAEAVLRQISELVAPLPNLVIITGHTDDRPPDKSGAQTTNWAISAAYGAGVVDYMVRKGGVDPRRLEVRARGEFQPIEDNETAEGQARNRRVELLVSRLPAKLHKARPAPKVPVSPPASAGEGGKKVPEAKP